MDDMNKLMETTNNRQAEEEIEVPEETMSVIKSRTQPGDVWYVYENRAFDSAAFGNRINVVTGPTRTLKSPPKTLAGLDIPTPWAYVLIGRVKHAASEEG